MAPPCDRASGPGAVTLEVLFFDGCPSHERLLPVVRALAAEHGVQLMQRRIEDASHAEHVRFLGSPSVRVNGVDVEPGADERADFGLKCRLYRLPEGLSGLPPEAWIRRALGSSVAR